MRTLLQILISCFMFNAGPATALDRNFMGMGFLLNNDYLGDGHDRWRTGSINLSFAWKHEPTIWGNFTSTKEFVELRLRAEAITPSSLASPQEDDRLYAGVTSVGIHKHIDFNSSKLSLGIDLVAVGSSTGISRVQREIHDFLSKDDFGVTEEVKNGIHPTALAEFSRGFEFGDLANVQPFIEIQSGIESFARLGVDVEFFNLKNRCPKVRDSTTGHEYFLGNCRGGVGSSVVLSGDVARVFKSRLLPSNQEFKVSNPRVRLRAGFGKYGKDGSFFYGLTWLSREFSSQSQAQVIGSVSINIYF